MIQCKCKDFKPGLKQIDDCIVFCSFQLAGPKYNFKYIEYCPWCGCLLQIKHERTPEVKRAIEEETDD